MRRVEPTSSVRERSTGMRCAKLLVAAPLGALLLLRPGLGHAACSGSGLAWTCTAGSTAAQVQSAIDGSPDQATITFASGAYDFGSTWIKFATSHGTSLVCETPGACAVKTAGTTFGIASFTGAIDYLYRISGFAITTSSTNYVIWFDTETNGSGTLSNIRIDQNTFNVPAESEVILFGDVSAVDANYYGVVDHNTLTSPGSAMLVLWIGGGQKNPPPSPLGTGNNMFVEDNVVDNKTMTNAGRGCTDSWGGAAFVVRHNTFKNCLVSTHGSLHAGGPQNWELYENKIILNDPSTQSQGVGDCYRCFHHQGSGEFVAYDNELTPYSGHSNDAIAMLYYRDEASLASSEGGTVCDGNDKSVFFDGKSDGNRSPIATYAGYPCWHQPARDFQGNLMPIYAWGNAWSDTKAKVDFNFEDYGGAYAQHWVADRDWYNAVGGAQTSPTAPFNGTTGMGYGTLANRPTTCSTGKTDPADQGKGGVGYFATDVGPHGTLYMCSAPNTWTVYYTPYPYPHPLVSGIAPANTDAGATDGGSARDGGTGGGGTGEGGSGGGGNPDGGTAGGGGGGSDAGSGSGAANAFSDGTTSNGCSCRTTGSSSSGAWPGSALTASALLGLRRRRRRSPD